MPIFFYQLSKWAWLATCAPSLQYSASVSRVSLACPSWWKAGGPNKTTAKKSGRLRFYSLYASRHFRGKTWGRILYHYMVYTAGTGTVYSRGLQRDVVHLGWPKAPSYMSPNAGGVGELRGLSQREQLYTGAQINFGDLTSYLTFGIQVLYLPYVFRYSDVLVLVVVGTAAPTLWAIA